MYDKIKEIIQVLKKEEFKCYVDWNSLVGRGEEGKTLGEYGLGKRNERRSRLVEFCTEYNLVITNTWFKSPERSLYTWKRPGDNGRYQIDCITVRQMFRNQVLKFKTYPGEMRTLNIIYWL